MENAQHQNTGTSIGKQAIEEGKTIAIISYLTLVGLVVAIVMNKEKKNEFAQFHIRQSLGITVVGIVLGLLGLLPVVGSILSMVTGIIILIMWIMGLLSAFSGQKKPIMLVGGTFQDWFKQI